MQKISIHNEEKVKELLENNGEKTFRYSQIENAIYKNFITDFDEMTTLSKNVRELLKENCFFDSLTLDQEISSDNEQTTKMLWKTSTGEFIESVIMRHLSGRVTLCVSCQAGCPMACSFCATGKLGLQKNLTAYEIIEQIFYAAKMINSEGARLRNIVFMGMGEPFLNYNVVKEVIQFASHQKKFDLGNRRITVSTCGIVPGIIKFTEDFPQTSLAVSLHAPNDEIRKKIMPVDHTWPLEKLMEALDAYTKKTNKRIFYEYIMINGVNDHIKLAHELGKLLEGRLAHVNFIPYNPGEGTASDGFSSTPRFIIEKFQSILKHYGIPSTIRATMGDDIDAACGQLANKRKQEF
ncbi:23S rRNA (adenine(2503)-C(2))-methyltransferase [Candidatus Gracilibacteria bacterium GN02-872]|nr:23S rRNA (adenine(2503)-C(2))-methyltransferase [Candidatus Gracilibacteria bacterium GN02-872]